MRLYHASPVKNLKLLKPQRTLSNDKYIGDFVFATRHKKLALMYMLPKGFPLLMNIESSKPYVVLSGNEKNIIKNDKGGALYIMPSNSFHKTPQARLSDYEMVSKEPVVPLAMTVYESVIKVLNEEDIDIYFVDSKIFDVLINNPKQDSLVRNLDRYTP